MYLTLKAGVKYNWMKEYYPLEYELVKNISKKVVGISQVALWDANDTNVPSPESFFRNILLGQQFYKQEFELNLQISSCRTVLDSVIHCPLLQHIVA